MLGSDLLCEPFIYACAQVVSNRMQKSILVAIDSWKDIPKYKTRIKRTKKLMVRSRTRP